jgi:hypothetical protein
MLTKRQLALTAAILLVGVLALNLTVAFLARNSLPRRTMRHARESQSASVLALGNSLMAAGFDSAAFDRSAGLSAPHNAVNLGLGSTFPVEHLLVFRYAFSHGMRPHLLINGFYDFQLTAADRFAIGDLIGNHSMLYYLEPSYARHFYSLSSHDSLEFGTLHSFPMFAERGTIWAKVEILRRSIAEQGMPAQRSNRFGRASDFSLLESDNADAFRRQCEASLELPLSPPVQELFRQARDAGISIVVVEMPMRQAHRTLFYDTPSWNQYVAHIRNLLVSFGATFVDASRWVENDSLFADPLHLSDEGAAQFSHRLGNLLGPEVVRLSVNSAASTPPRSARP